jgi:hypothetical protein
MNAGGVPNTCKSSGKAPAVCLSGDRSRNFFEISHLHRSDERSLLPKPRLGRGVLKESAGVHERRTAE